MQKRFVYFFSFVAVSGLSVWGFQSLTDKTQNQSEIINSVESKIETQIAVEPVNTTKVIDRPISPEDTFYTVLTENNVSSEEANSILAVTENIYDFNRLHAGRILRLVFAQEVLASVEYPLSDEQMIVVERQDDTFIARTEEIPYDALERTVTIPITSVFYIDALEKGLDDQTIMNLAGLYSWDIDFTADVSLGDSVTVVYEERRNQESSEIVDTKIIAAQARINGKDFYAFRYGEGDGISFYDYDGTELAKSFLRTPLAFGSVSSGYTQSRVNPVTRVVQPHRAIDYAAPAGTAIYATADGVVSLAGWKDNAYGYTVEIKHTNGYKTQYAHMSEVAKGIKRNSEVIQGETIGYVGSSGISTGPHLQYALFKDGTPVNPLSDDLPIGTTLEGEKFDDFIKTRETLQAKLSSSN